MEQPAAQPEQPEPVSVAGSGLPLRRSADNRVVGGVCGGLAEYTDIDPIIYRVLTVVLALVGGAGLILYGAAMLLIPDPRTGTAPLGKLFAGGRGRGMRAAGVVLAIVCLLVVTGGLSGVFGGGSLSIVVIAGLAVLVAHRRGVNFKNLVRGAADGAPGASAQAPTDQAATDQARPAVASNAPPTTTAWTPQPPSGHPQTHPFTAPPQGTPTPTPPPAAPTAPGSAGYFDFATLGTDQPTSRSAGQPPQRRQVRSITWPVLAVAAGVGGLVVWLQHLGEIAGDVRVPLAAALGALGLGLVASAWVGRARVKGWGVLLTLALGAATVLIGPYQQVHWSPITWTPTSTASLAAAQPYHVDVGVAELDLTELPMRAGRTYPARVTADAGQLVVLVPHSAAVDITANCEQCVVEAFGQQLATGQARVERHLPASSPTARSGSPDRSTGPVVDLDLNFDFGHIEVRRAA